MSRLVRQHDSLESFRNAAHHLYQADPVLFCTELGALGELTTTPRPALYLTVHEEDRPCAVGAALRPLAFPLMTSGLDDEDAAVVARFLAERSVSIPGLLGLASAADVFARQWQQCTGVQTAMCIYETVYQLGELRLPPPSAGAARLAQRGDRPLLVEWLGLFHAEAFGRPADAASTRGFLTHVIAAGSQFIVWEVAGAAVSVARLHPAVQGVARIGPVFTPVEHRRWGYGAAVTATAAALAFEGGASAVVLQTDTANATANALYQRLGFSPVATSAQVTFAAAS